MKKKIWAFLFVLAAVFLPPIQYERATAAVVETPQQQAFLSGLETGYYYDQLSSRSKGIYDVILSSPLGNSGVATDVDAQIDLGLEKTWENTLFVRETAESNFSLNATTDAEVDAWFSQVRADAMSALYALLYDEPELSWLINVGYVFSTKAQAASVSFTQNNPLEGTGDYTVTASMSLNLSDREKASSTGTYADFSQALTVAVTALQADNGYDIDGEGKTRYEQVKAIHDYVCQTVTYASGDLSLREYQTVYSSLISPTHTTVCAGYAKMFKVLCDAFEIPCVLVSGSANNGKQTEEHMWNYVQMQSGLWYAVDTTWDDAFPIRYDYFLKGADIFDADHFADGRIDGENTLVYPVLSAVAYDDPIQEWSVSAGQGENVKAYLFENKTQLGKYDLVIEGTGNVLGAESFEEMPWAEYVESILTVRISKDVQSIGQNAFSGFETLTIYAHENTNVDEDYPDFFQSLCAYSDCEDTICNGCGQTRTAISHVDTDSNGECDGCGKEMQTNAPSQNTQSSETSSSVSGGFSSQGTADVSSGGCSGTAFGGAAIGAVGVFLMLLKKKRR